MALNEQTDLGAEAKAAAPARSDAIPHGDILASHIGLLCLGKSDFEAVNGMREDDYFCESLGLKQVPSEGTLRQRMDAHAPAFLPVVQDASLEFLQRVDARMTPLDNGLVPLDADVTPFDNSGTQKEGVSFTDGGLSGSGGLLPGAGTARRQTTLSEGHARVSAPQLGTSLPTDR